MSDWLVLGYERILRVMMRIAGSDLCAFRTMYSVYLQHVVRVLQNLFRCNLSCCWFQIYRNFLQQLLSSIDLLVMLVAEYFLHTQWCWRRRFSHIYAILLLYKLTLNNIIAFVLFRHVCMTWLSRNYCVKETRMNAKLNHIHRPDTIYDILR